MVEHTKSFGDFWGEIKRPFALGSIKTLFLFPVAVLIAIPVVRGFQCIGWMGSAPQQLTACAELSDPTVLISNIMTFLPILLKGTLAALPWLFLAILYLEWDKYKKDKPSGFTHEKGCEGYPGYTRRLKWVTANEWEIADKKVPAISLGEQSKRYQGAFTEQDLLKSLRRKFARTENKPIEDSQDRIRWRTVQMNGREVHIDVERTNLNPPTWVMTTKFFEWTGRKTPPSLVETHTTEFVAMADSGSDSAS